MAFKPARRNDPTFGAIYAERIIRESANEVHRPIGAAASLLAATCLIAAQPAASAENTPPQITVSGEGEIALAPDMAVLSLAVVSQEETARKALDANSEAMAGVLAAMREMGVADRDLQTSAFSITPNYVYPKRSSEPQTPEIVGYQVHNALTVRVRDLTKLGAFIDRRFHLASIRAATSPSRTMIPQMRSPRPGQML